MSGRKVHDTLWLYAKREVAVYIFCSIRRMLGGRFDPLVGGGLAAHAKFGVEMGSSWEG